MLLHCSITARGLSDGPVAASLRSQCVQANDNVSEPGQLFTDR